MGREIQLKEKGVSETPLTEFDLLGYKENSLSYTLAYLLSKSYDFYFDFLKEFLNITKRKSRKHYKNVKIQVQKWRNKGITDIEIKNKEDYHIIIECKIGKNKVKGQREKYLDFFDDNVDNKYIVFLTQDFESFNIPIEGISDRYITWLEVFKLIATKGKKYNKDLFEKFNRYIERGHNMTEFSKEVLVQDISKYNEIKRFNKFYIYRRDESSGKPLYFAPYYTNNCEKTTGITHLARILGVLTLKPNKRKIVDNRIKNFADEKEEAESKEKLIQKWKKGLKLGDSEKVKTYYFLDKPIKLPGVAKKNKMKNSTGWIGGHIPKNRTISFQNLLNHLE